MSAQQTTLIIDDPAKVAECLFNFQKPYLDALAQKADTPDPLGKYPGTELSFNNIKEILGVGSYRTVMKRLNLIGVSRIEGSNRYDKEAFRKAYFGK